MSYLSSFPLVCVLFLFYFFVIFQALQLFVMHACFSSCFWCFCVTVLHFYLSFGDKYLYLYFNLCWLWVGLIQLHRCSNITKSFLFLWKRLFTPFQINSGNEMMLPCNYHCNGCKLQLKIIWASELDWGQQKQRERFLILHSDPL